MIKLENVSKYYYSVNSVVPALRKINLEFKIGEFIAITGESGSGKSTLLNIISGLDTYDDGELSINQTATSYYDDADWEDYRKNKIGFVFQNYGLIDNYTVIYNVESSLLIQGYHNKEAKKVAHEILKKVGLEDKISQKASNLSSGQKQRLSIARALAKSTDIIVADEPTGNLDSETGKQIMELFRELSKDRLVIIVTHNYEEAEPYVTRKIRLNDGEVVADIMVRQLNKSEDDSTSAVQAPLEKESRTNALQAKASQTKELDKAVKSDRKIAWSFARMNISTQPGRVILFLIIFLLTAATMFLFLGEIYSHWDDTYTKVYDPSAFLNSDNTRIVVTKQDDSPITNEDIMLFNSIKKVLMADRYGFANDINYYIKLDSDYTYITETNYTWEGKVTAQRIDFLDNSHFMKSSTCITEEDLRAGSLPKERNEVVIYSKDNQDIGKEQPCIFTATNIWGYQEYYTLSVKVVGILKKECDQVYFSDKLCNMLTTDMYGDGNNLDLYWDRMLGQYTEKTSFVPVIGEEIENQTEDSIPYNLRVSSYLYLSHGKARAGDGKLTFYKGGKDSDGIADFKHEINIEPEFNVHSSSFIEMSEKIFNQLYHHESSQASLFIKDYIDTDYVLKQLAKKGYVAISSYRISSVNYDNKKLTERNKILLQAILVILIVSILEIIIVKSIFRLKHKSFIILGSMGMSHKTVKMMNYYEMLIYTTAAIFITPLIANVLRLSRYKYLINMIKYYNRPTYSIYIALNLFVTVFIVWSFNRYLKRKQKWS